MTITQVLYVLEAASCRNISRAAERLFISQSALSQQLLRLEHELGYPLFARASQGLQLTEAGAQFCQEARPVIDAWQTFCKRVQSQNSLVPKQLRVGMGSRVYSNGLFPDIIKFFDTHTELEVTFVTEAGRDFPTELKEGRLDAALDRLPSEDFLEKQRDFYTCSLVQERQCVLMSPEDPRTSLAAIRFPDLQGSTVMSGLENSAEDRILKEMCRQYGIALNRVFRSDGIETNMDLVRRGTGVVLGPRSFANDYRVSAVDLSPETYVSLRFICLRDYMKREEIRLFRDHLRSVCRAHGLMA